MPYDVQIARSPERNVAVVRTRTTFAEIPTVMASSFARAAEFLGRRGMLGGGPAIGWYTEMDPVGGGVTVAAGFVVAAPIEGDGTIEPDVLPEAEVATATHLGPYSDVSAAYDAIAAAVAERGRRLDETTMWEEYWSPPGTPDEQTKTVVYCPLRSD